MFTSVTVRVPVEIVYDALDYIAIQYNGDYGESNWGRASSFSNSRILECGTV
jgi:hypothetical protein